ncbi:hypothetical protein PLESTM_001054400 [Pleodorina starrii]|nr:hypothetical protein PLESTM_001054400 [Pleodorina starrii]
MALAGSRMGYIDALVAVGVQQLTGRCEARSGSFCFCVCFCTFHLFVLSTLQQLLPLLLPNTTAAVVLLRWGCCLLSLLWLGGGICCGRAGAQRSAARARRWRRPARQQGAL